MLSLQRTDSTCLLTLNFKRFFLGRIKAQWWVTEKNLEEEVWFTYHSLKCPNYLAGEGFILRAAKRKVAHPHLTPLLIFQVVFPWLSKNFFCYQLTRQACLHYAASNGAPGITLLLHYQTFWTSCALIAGRERGRKKKKSYFKVYGQVCIEVKCWLQRSSHKECLFLKPVGSGPLPKAKSGGSTGPSAFRPREGGAFTSNTGKSSYNRVWPVEEWIRSQSFHPQKLSRTELDQFHNFVLRETKLLTKFQNYWPCSRN